jgi:hypothetical protein
MEKDEDADYYIKYHTLRNNILKYTYKLHSSAEAVKNELLRIILEVENS